VGNTDILTSELGFGSATLFRLPQRSGRRRVLDAALAAGIQHYDVAPIYGLGRAEAELAAFLGKRRNEVTITTKFGLEPTVLGRAAGWMQSPIRFALQHLPHVQGGLQTSARGPASGSAGRALYRREGFTPKSAEADLTRSLRALKTDYIDIFVLHEPVGQLPESFGLAEHLNAERDRGRIRAWGTAGDDYEKRAEILSDLPGLEVVQHRYDLPRAGSPSPEDGGLGRITFGILAQPLQRILSLLSSQRALARTMSDMLGADVSQPDNLVGLLLRDALRRNTRGPVLFTTTRPDRVARATSAVETASTPLECEVLQRLGEALNIGRDAVGGAT